jgi:protein pelota
MKLVTRNLVPNGPGYVKLLPQVDDDLWDAYNLIAAGDTVEAVTVRKIGGRDTERVKLTLEIAVQSVEYATEDSLMRVRGKNQTKNEYVQIGQYHTLELEIKRPFVLRKEVWDWPALDRIQQSCDETAANADLAVLLMQEGLTWRSNQNLKRIDEILRAFGVVFCAGGWIVMGVSPHPSRLIKGHRW